MLAGGVFMGLLASVLSQSRGGWLALLLLLPVLLWLALRWLPAARVWRGAGAMALVALLLGAAFHDSLRQRTALAWQEVQAYEDSGEAHTSIGQRLAHWKLAWRLGLDKPLLGWGSAGYEQEKHLRAERGEVSPFVTQFSHAHNELLDTLARRGLLGVMALLCFYAVPLAMFWPTRRRAQRCQAQARDEDLALRLVGICLVVSYIGFGFTQVFFAHNSGNLFYLFMVAILHGMLLQRGAQRRRSLRPGAGATAG
jgi:O-antigen ligase